MVAAVAEQKPKVSSTDLEGERWAFLHHSKRLKLSSVSSPLTQLNKKEKILHKKRKK